MLGLAASLSTLDFRPTWIQPAGSLATSLDWWLFWARLLAIGGLLVTLAVLLIGVIARPAHLGPKPKMGSPLIAVLLTLFLIGLLDPEALKALLRLQPAPAATTPANATPAPSAVAPPALANWLVWAVSVALAVLLLWAAWRLWRLVPTRASQVQAPAQLQLARAARLALQELQGGADPHNVIVRCYREMSRIVGEKRQLYREAYLTPREFVTYMERAGVPAQPAAKLTALFEAARYGAKELSAQSEADAVACLQALAEALEK